MSTVAAFFIALSGAFLIVPPLRRFFWRTMAVGFLITLGAGLIR